YNATASGSNIIDGKFGNARRFDGTNDYINTYADIDYGTGTAITVSAWFNYHNCTGADGICYIVSKGQYASGSAYTLLVTNTGVVRLSMMSTSVSSESGFNDGKWHYAVGVLSGTTGYIYVDGHLQTSGTLSPTNNNEYVIIGSDDASSTYRPFDGAIDEVEIYNVALTASQIYAKFLEGSSQSIVNTKTAALNVEGDNALEIETQYSFVDGNTAGYWHLDESSGSGAYLLDESYNGNDGTPSGTTYTADGKYNGARYFDGVDDTITTSLDTAADSLYAASGYTWTVECWFKYSGGLSTDGMIIGRGGGTGTSATFGIYVDTSNQLRSVIRGGYTTLASSVNDGQWNHIALTWDGSTGTYYYNGVYAGNLTIGTASVQSHTVSFGATSSGTLYYFNGYIDEIKISDVRRSSAEIRQSYRWGKGSYISQPVTSSDLSSSSMLPFWFASDKLGNNIDVVYGESAYANYEPDANTIGLWRFDEQRTGSYTEDDSGYINNGVATGTTYNPDGVLSGAKTFNGSSDYVTVSSGIDLANKSFSIDAWAKRSSTGSYDFFVTQGSDSTNNGLHFGFRNTNTFTLAFWNNDLTTTETFTDGQWHYYTATYDASTNDRRIYVDGVLLANNTASADYQGTGNLVIGARRYSTYYYYGGSLDEVRISDTVRSVDEIRQAYEVGKRTHSIVVDFKADLESSNLISSSADTSFTINEQNYGTVDYIENIDIGEKIIVKETDSGTEYFAQGDIASVNTSTGAITVDSWDTGSTFPTSGYTTAATVFKWQEEYIDVRYPLSEDIDGLTNLTFKKVTDSISTFWIDNAQKSTYSSDYNASSFSTISDVQYVQYQAIFTKWDDNTNLDLYLTEVEITYSSGPTMDQLMRHGKWFDSSGQEQPFWWVGN
ncbi:MAG: LamG domain-containing protein, partial [Candidatus Dojkabacteria bacterium]|nr:LamG domain-containing protein [Candidatus Dojkabacteria bacterium]